MNEIKEYSTHYATKLAYVISTISEYGGVGTLTAIEKATNEKDTTAKNWLFNGKLPRESKRLAIADAVGTSAEYLFNDAIAVTDIRKPEIVKKDNCYFVPMVEDSDVFLMKQAQRFPIKTRLPVMLPHMDDLVATYGKNIYATKLSSSNFQPYIEENATVIYSENILLEDYKFVLIGDGHASVTLKRIIKVDGKFRLMRYNKEDDEVLECIPDKSNMLLVLLSFSTS